MTQILFKSATIEMGKTVLKILKFLTLAIARSTWILTEAILQVSVSSSSDRCSLLWRKGGMLNEIPFGRSLSFISHNRVPIFKQFQNTTVIGYLLVT